MFTYYDTSGGIFEINASTNLIESFTPYHKDCIYRDDSDFASKLQAYLSDKPLTSICLPAACLRADPILMAALPEEARQSIERFNKEHSESAQEPSR